MGQERSVKTAAIAQASTPNPNSKGIILSIRSIFQGARNVMNGRLTAQNPKPRACKGRPEDTEMANQMLQQSRALDMLHHASVYVSASFEMKMDRAAAKANLEARVILFNCSNKIFAENGCPISREEVEGAAILDALEEN